MPAEDDGGGLQVNVCVLPGGVCPGGVTPGFMSEAEPPQQPVPELDPDLLMKQHMAQKSKDVVTQPERTGTSPMPTLDMGICGDDPAVPPGFIEEDEPEQREVTDFDHADPKAAAAAHGPPVAVPPVQQQSTEQSLALNCGDIADGAVPPGFLDEAGPEEVPIDEVFNEGAAGADGNAVAQQQQQQQALAQGADGCPDEYATEDCSPEVIAADVVSARDVSGAVFTDRRLRELFNRLDRDGSGTLERSELRRFVADGDSLGSDLLDPHFVDNTLSRYGVLRDGRVTFDEFCIVMCRLAAL
eukprot:TRINITY_DN7353_c0_g1_i1.p1 TRINITY_DN7353_c0_g1~~TRINITY_DN7353_c0_g1_i1.p1  ORF type:complete len:334 (+),score=103.71 TRINITY_DN7353_c0_g1_i1:104-1003(+)